MCTDDDPYCPGENAARFWAQPLGLTVDLLPGAGHLNVEAGYGPWPEMEAWCLGERATRTVRPRRDRPGCARPGSGRLGSRAA